MSAGSDLQSVRDTLAGWSVGAAVGAVALVLAALTAFVPVLGEAVAGTVGVLFGNPVVVVLASIVGGGYGLVRLYRLGSSTTGSPALVANPPERASYDQHEVTGSSIDESVAAVGSELPESSAKDWWTYREKSDVESTLEHVTVCVLASEHDVSSAAATQMVEDGSWTDDPRATAFLSDDVGSALPLRVQFVDWLSGEAYQRRVDATVDAIARHAGLEAESTDAGHDRTATGSALAVHEVSEDARREVESRARTAEEDIETAATGSREPTDEDGAVDDRVGREAVLELDSASTANVRGEDT
jgi:hypothetical protein